MELKVPFGEDIVDSMDDEYLLKLSKSDQQDVMGRRKEYVEEMENNYVALVIGHGIDGGFCHNGIVLVKRGKDYLRMLHKIQEILSRNLFDCNSAVELQHIGIPVLDFCDINKDYPIISLTKTSKFGKSLETGRTATKDPFSMDDVSVSDKHKENKEQTTKPFNTTYVCGNCNKEYVSILSKSEYPSTFCSKQCQRNFEVQNALLQVCSEILPNKPEVCNMRAPLELLVKNAEIVFENKKYALYFDYTIQKAGNGVEILDKDGISVGFFQNVRSAVEHLYNKSNDVNKSNEIELHHLEKSFLKNLAGMTIRGSFTLPNIINKNTTIRPPNPGYVWVVCSDGDLIECEEAQV